MGVESVVNTELYNVIFRKGMKMDFFSETLAGNKVITVDYPPVLILDPNTSTRDIELPEEALSKGLMFFILNDGDGSQALVIKDDGGTPIVTSAFPENMWVHCDGVKWRGIVSKGIT